MILDAIDRAYAQLTEKSWNTIYWSIDLHGTCFKSNYEPGQYEWINHKVHKTLRYISCLPESVIILWSSCYPIEQENIKAFFRRWGVEVTYFNENPEVINTLTGCFDKKFYTSIIIDDKAGFNPETDWELIYKHLCDG